MLSPDPVTQAPENGQNYNRYSYANNNPLKYVDTNGYEFGSPGIGVSVSTTGAGFGDQFNNDGWEPPMTVARSLGAYIEYYRSVGHPAPVQAARSAICANQNCSPFGYNSHEVNSFEFYFHFFGVDSARTSAANFLLYGGDPALLHSSTGDDTDINGNVRSLQQVISHYADNVGDVSTYASTIATIATFVVPGSGPARVVATAGSLVGVIADIAKGDIYSAKEGFSALAGSKIFEMMVDRVPGFKQLPGEAQFRIVAGIMSVYQLTATAREAAEND